MTALFIYLIKANIALCLFYLAYRLGLRRLTFYTLNRVFLITGIVFSSLFPLVDVNDFFSRNEIIAAQVVQYVPDFGVLQAAQPEAFTVWALLEWVFWTGVVVMGLRLAIQLISLLVLHRRSEPANMQGQDVRKMDGDINPFSFFNNIYVNPDMHSEEELEAIIRHEQIHVRQWHSADVMMSEVNNVFYWFNPGAWLMKTAVKENLEFITDRKILRSGVNAATYQYSLVKVSTAQYAAGVANNFNFSHLKNRIKMMNKTTSSRVHLYRYGVLAGVVCGVLLSLNYTKAGTVVNHVVSEVKDVLEIAPGDTTTPVQKDQFSAKPVETRKPVEEKFQGVKADQFQTIEGKSQKPDNIIELTEDGVNATLHEPGGTAATLNGKKLTMRGGKNSSLPTNTIIISNASGTTGAAAGSRPTRGSYAGVMRLGGAGNSPAVTFRADTTNKPLIVVDGKPYPPNGINYPTLNNLDPNTIESITVLKDKSASAIYGSAGNYGVILITTKKGADEKKRTEPNKLKEVTVVGYPSADEQQENMLNQVVVVGYGTKNTNEAKAGTGDVKEEVVVTGYSSKNLKADSTATYRTGKQTMLALAKTDGAADHASTSTYPNPTKGIVNVAFTIPKASNSNFLEVTDMNGKPLYRQSLAGYKGSYKGQVDLTRYPAASYIIKVKLDGADMSSIVVKQ
ncbi:M56 family metallopeptidase [Chitinophaga sp. GCM10012297]|uniref:TonB-dependent receptor plug domain-containing protein n=1 Tax=Chitinophaga chungangae TaxID=2821488 RepID=A0ABS3Y962_9BACT|nr:M56 family metallopeptidase [Chitinophaga chungangae]MBO9151030.1 TonB-dependent receptor plug domain-containing protein [Chitinophaga chungangae]